MGRRAEISGQMNLDTSRVNKALKQTELKAKRFASAVSAQILRIGAAFAGVGLIKNIIRLGTEAEETANKFNAVFGAAAKSINEKIEELKKTIPATTRQMRESISTIGQMARAFGLNEDAANDLSVELIKITGDLASFNNMRFEEAFIKIRSAISGEFEPLKQLGIVINETRLKHEGLNTGVWDGTGAMSAAQKALVVHSILIRDMGDAHGDAAATADSAANKIKSLKVQLEEAATSIGQTSLPAILNMVNAMADLVKFTDNAATAVGKFAGELAFGSEKNSDMRSARGQAERDLIGEGKISKKSPRGLGSRKKRKERGRLIEERAQLIMQQRAEGQTKKETEATEKLNTELENQIKNETDPARKKALEDRLSIYEKLVEKAGKLNSAKNASIALTKAQKEAEEMLAQGDTNQDGIVTGREKRAKERQERKKASERRRARTKAVANESRAGLNRRKQETADRMSERERANGLTDTVSMPRDIPTVPNPDAQTPNTAKDGSESPEIKEQTARLTNIDENLQGLMNAIGGGQ